MYFFNWTAFLLFDTTYYYADEFTSSKLIAIMSSSLQLKQHQILGKGWKIKYYKGLGTSTSAEAKDYFRYLENSVLSYEVY
jgi:DNA gyrase/topoisomerase IV subunit B